MHAEIVAIHVNDLKLFAPTGPIGRYRASVAASMTRHAKTEAPMNSRTRKSRANAAYPVGSLKRLISTSTANITARQFEIITSSGAPYSTYVLKGTSRIYSRSARVPKGQPGAGQFAPLDWGGHQGMYIPPGMGHKALIRQSVSGQAANNFLERAFDRTAVAHPSLRGFGML